MEEQKCQIKFIKLQERDHKAYVRLNDSGPEGMQVQKELKGIKMKENTLELSSIEKEDYKKIAGIMGLFLPGSKARRKHGKGKKRKRENNKKSDDGDHAAKKQIPNPESETKSCNQTNSK